MAYLASRGSLRCVTPGIAGNAGKSWLLDNPDNDAAAAIDTSGYITDALARGLMVGDVVNVINANAAAMPIFRVQAINANGSADLFDAAAASATDTD
jgi:hypothetical protein